MRKLLAPVLALGLCFATAAFAGAQTQTAQSSKPATATQSHKASTHSKKANHKVKSHAKKHSAKAKKQKTA